VRETDLQNVHVVAEPLQRAHDKSQAKQTCGLFASSSYCPCGQSV
jgi:hypothetical protein